MPCQNFFPLINSFELTFHWLYALPSIIITAQKISSPLRIPLMGNFIFCAVHTFLSFLNALPKFFGAIFPWFYFLNFLWFLCFYTLHSFFFFLPTFFHYFSFSSSHFINHFYGLAGKKLEEVRFNESYKPAFTCSKPRYGNTWTMYELCTKSTIKIPERRH